MKIFLKLAQLKIKKQTQIKKKILKIMMIKFGKLIWMIFLKKFKKIKIKILIKFNKKKKKNVNNKCNLMSKIKVIINYLKTIWKP